MPHGRFAVIDPAAGISGDMLLGALIGAGAPRDWLQGLPARLGIPEVSVGISTVDRAGVQAVKVEVSLPGGVTEPPAAEWEQPGPAGHQDGHADHGHRHIGELIRLVERAPLSEWVRERAVRAFRLLGEAEGRVHGKSPESVALHEVGALDAVVDIVGGIEGFERLGVTAVYARPLALGDGWVRAAHGTMAVPAPATAYLVEGLDVGPNGPVRGEATTPTGAVLLRVLADGPPPPRWRATGAIGWGAGGRNPSGYANALRIFVAEPAAEAADVVILATDVDDLSPEYLEPLREALMAAGALDVVSWPTQMKKGRIGFRVEAVAPPGAAGAVGEALLRNSTTAGFRRLRAERTTLDRRELNLEAAPGVPVRVKVLRTPDGVRAKPEFEDVRKAALSLGRPAHEVARDLQYQALRRLAEGESPVSQAVNQDSEE